MIRHPVSPTIAGLKVAESEEKSDTVIAMLKSQGQNLLCLREGWICHDPRVNPPLRPKHWCCCIIGRMTLRDIPEQIRS